MPLVISELEHCSAFGLERRSIILCYSCYLGSEPSAAVSMRSVGMAPCQLCMLWVISELEHCSTIRLERRSIILCFSCYHLPIVLVENLRKPFP